jgi:hypothetical protein
MDKKFRFRVTMGYHEYYEVTATSLRNARTIMNKSIKGEHNHPLYQVWINETLHDNWGDATPTRVELLS